MCELRSKGNEKIQLIYLKNENKPDANVKLKRRIMKR